MCLGDAKDARERLDDVYDILEELSETPGGEGDDEAYDLRMGAEEAIKALSKAMDAVDEVVDLQEEYEYSITHDGR